MKYIVGIDEVGRGSIAGPVVVALCMIIKNKSATEILNGIRDSKQLTKKQRNEWFLKLKDAEKNKILFCATSFVSSEIIDKKGIMYSLRKATNSCLKKIKTHRPESMYVLLDGTLVAPGLYRQKTIIGGDRTETAISAASVYAKVKRDLYMDSESLKYVNYGFDKNKGYGTKTHIQAIKKYGLSKIHRKTFCTKF